MPTALHHLITPPEPPPALDLLIQAYEGSLDAVILCTQDGRIVHINGAGVELLGVDLATVRHHPVHTLVPNLDVHRGHDPVRRPLTLHHSSGVALYHDGIFTTVRGPSGEDVAWVLMIRPKPSSASPFDLLQQLHVVTSERRLTLEQRLDAIFRLGIAHFRMPRLVQSRIEGRHYVVERCIDPTGHVHIEDDVPLAGTYCEHTLRADRPTAFHHAGQNEIREEDCYLNAPYEAYLGTPVFVDAVRYGTLAFTSDMPRAPFTAEDLVLARLLAQVVGHELARDRDLRLYQRAQDDLDRLAHTDALTRLPNRRAIQEALHWQVAYVRRSSLPLTVVICDLDRFKQVNDRYGHDAGDAVLRAFADICRQQKRETDVCGRWGGEEFLILLPNTRLEGAQVFADRLLQAVRSTPIQLRDGTVITVTASLGGATIWSTESDEAVVSRADQALYRAKDRGRDQAILDDQSTPVPRDDR